MALSQNMSFVLICTLAESSSDEFASDSGSETESKSSESESEPPRKKIKLSLPDIEQDDGIPRLLTIVSVY